MTTSTPRSPAPPPILHPVRSVVSPLWPVLLPLVVTAIVLGAVFARLFPPANAADTPLLRFTDVTAESGLDFSHQQGGTGAPTTLGGAVAVLDYNNDGAPDLFFVNGAPWPWEETLQKRPGRSSALLRNDGSGRFTDVTARAGLNVEMQGMAVAAGDFDGDGLTDLFVTCVGRNHLFHNLGAGRFEDVSEEAGVSGEDNIWSTGAAWIDYDGDGRLDLVVLHYARWPREVGLAQAFAIAEVGRSYGSPAGFISAFPSVYRNLGGGHFALVPDSAGLRDIDPETGRPVAQPLALALLDANGDGRLDLLVTYQNNAPALFIAGSDGTFTKQVSRRASRQEGAAASLVSASAIPLADETGTDARAQILPGFVAGNFPAGDGPPLSLPAKLGFALADFNLDGHEEIFSGEGAAELHLNKFEAGRDFARTPVMLGQKNRGWRPLAWDAANTWLTALTARGIAAADFDGDGDEDVVIAQNNGHPLMLRNDQRSGSPWLRLRLIAKHGHPEAGGARVEVHTPRHIFVRTVAPAMGFMAQSESTLTFGLGDDARVRQIVVTWPDGARQEIRPDGINRLMVITQP